MPNVTISSPGTLNEGNSGTTHFVFTVTRDSGAGEALVDYYLWSNEADGSDFGGAVGGTLRFADGETSKVISVPVVGDAAVEADETFHVALSNGRGLTIVNGEVSATIKNDDAPGGGGTGPTGFSITASGDQAEGNEGSAPINFTVTRTGDASGAGAVDYYLWSPQTDSADFVGSTTGTVYFAAGETSKTVQIHVAGDRVAEADETFHVSLSNARGGSIVTGEASAKIMNDDGGATTDHKPVAANDTDTVQLGSSTPATGNLITDASAGDAGDSDDGADNAGPDGPLTVVAVRTTHTADTNPEGGFVQIGRFGTLTVQANGDYSYVLTSNPEPGVTDIFGYEVRDADGDPASASLSIQVLAAPGGGGGPQTVSISSPGTLNEGNSGTTSFNFTVTRTSAEGPALVDYYMWSNQADGSDFGGSVGGTLRFADGETSKVITVPVVGDTTLEGDETFYVALSNARLGSGQALSFGTREVSATIKNDDASSGGGGTGGSGPTPIVSIADGGTIHEKDGEGVAITFNVFRDGDLSQPLLVDYYLWGVADASDLAGQTSGTLRFASGQSMLGIDLAVVGDNTPEPTEMFYISLSNARGATIQNGTGSARIIDDDGWVVG
jgi:urease beta subunit